MIDIITKESIHDSYWNGFNSDFMELENLQRTAIAYNWLKGLGPKYVLDFGCGAGYLAKRIKESNAAIKIDGIDISSVALKYARKYLDHSWQTDIDSSNLQIEDGKYDAVVCQEILEHVYDVHHALSEIKRVLVINGKLLISVPNVAFWKYRLQLLIGQIPHPEVNDERHIRFYTYDEMRKRVEKAGLKITKNWGYGERFPKLASKHPKLLSSTLFLESCNI